MAKTATQSKDVEEALQEGTNKSPFIDATTAVEAYTESKNWLRPYFDPIPEFERIARNRPSEKISPELPKITDGTTASIIQESPKRIIQQVPTGLVKCKGYPEFAKMADIVLRDELIPSYNRMGDALQKDWNMLGKATTWGRAVSYTFFTTTNGKFHTDFVIPYVKDLLTEKGKVFGPDSNIIFMRSWYQKRDLQAIINREEAIAKADSTYKSDWDLALLKQFMEGGSSAKPADQQTPAEREKGGDTGGYEVIHAFQAGVGAEFYSFSPQFESGKTLRTKVNPDPRGKMPFDFLYCNIDLSNPLGRGIPELCGGVQNLMDQKLQMNQFLTTMLMGPPMKKWGTVNTATIKMRPNAIWDMGNNRQTNDIEPYEVNNVALNNFITDMQFLQSKIYNLCNSQDTSIGAKSGDANQSKTDAGVNAQMERLGNSDNYLRKQFEAWDSAQKETAINIFFAEMKGDKEIELSPDDVRDLKKSKAAEYLTQDNKLTIPYEKISNVSFKFQVDPSSSEIKEDSDNAAKLGEVYKLMASDPDPVIQQKKPQILKLLIDEIGAEGTDDLFPEFQKDENGQPVQQAPQGPDPNMIMQMVQQAVQQAMEQQKGAQKQISESIKWTPGDLTPDERAQALAQGGIQPDPQGVTPNQDQQATQTALDIAKTSHDHTIGLHNAASSFAQPPQQQAGAPGEQPSSSSHENGSPQASPQGSGTPLDAELSPEEESIVHNLLQRGFNEQDAEQAIVMLRQGGDPQQIIKTLGAKYVR